MNPPWYCFCVFSVATIVASWDNRKSNPQPDELIFVHAIWRNGWEVPEYDFLNGEGSTGQEDLLQLFNLGKSLRNRYIVNTSFLDTQQPYIEAYIQSIDHNRSLQGAGAKLAGMFPMRIPALEQTPGWPQNWIPMPIHMVPLDQDINLNGGISCSNYDAEKAKLVQNPDYKNLITENQEFLEYLRNKTGFAVTPDNIGNIFQMLQPFKNSKTKGLPTWISDQDNLDRMAFLTQKALHYKLINPTMVRIRGGPLATDILTRMERKWDALQNKTERSKMFDLPFWKYYGYAGREMSILWQLATFGAADFINDQVPNYASALLIELWNQNDKPHVAVLYHDGPADSTVSSTTGFVPVQIKDCPKLPARCPLETFRKVISTSLVTPANWSSVCGMGNNQQVRGIGQINLMGYGNGPQSQPMGKSQPGNNYQSLAIIFAIIIIVLTLFVVVQMCILMRPKNNPRYANLDERTLLVSSDIK